MALQQSHGDVVLVDFAPIGHAALHLNLRPQFGVLDALQNLHRLDVSLLDGLMTPTKEGLHLLAGPQQPYPTEPTPGELARLFDLLVNHYRFVVVDASSRLDPTTRLLSDLSNAVLVVAQTDVVSLWSAGRIHAFLEEGTGRDRLRMVLNRYKKIPGFTEDDIEQIDQLQGFVEGSERVSGRLPFHRSRNARRPAGRPRDQPLLPRPGSGLGRSVLEFRRKPRPRLWPGSRAQKASQPPEPVPRSRGTISPVLSTRYSVTRENSEAFSVVGSPFASWIVRPFSVLSTGY